MRQNSSTRLVLKMAEEKAKFRGIPRLVLEKAEGKGKIPRLVLDLEKQGTKVSSLKWLRKRPKFRGIPRLVLKKAEEKGKIPRLVSSSTSEKFYQRSRP